ncbi:MAG: hypothetical protein V4501_03060 [Pseudomonadota bacterium]
MSTKFEKYGQSFGYAAACLVTAAVGLTLSALASMNPVSAATVSPALVALTFEASKKLMTVAYDHLNEGLKIKDAENHHVKPTPNNKYLT